MDKLLGAADSLNVKRNIMIEKRDYNINYFMEQQKKYCKEADEVVLKFIANFLYHGVPEVDLDVSAESIRSTFRAGYCFYFAHMLKQAFNRGCVCWCAPYSHIVWVDVSGIPYDIEGVCYSEAEYYIPLDYLGDTIDSFMHIPDRECKVRDAQEIIDIFKADLDNGEIEKRGLSYL